MRPLERLPLPTGFLDPLDDDPDKGSCCWCGKDARWRFDAFECDDCYGKVVLGDPSSEEY
jgi:hypothetical protein